MIKITIHIKPTWISILRHMSRAIWRWWKCVRKCQSGKWSSFVVLKAHVRVLTRINGLSLQCKLCINNNYIYFDKKLNVLYSFKNGLCSHQPFNLTFGSSYIQGTLCINVLRITRHFTCFKCKVAGLLWLHILAWKFVEVVFWVSFCNWFSQFVSKNKNEKSWRCSIVELFPTSESNRHSAHFLVVFVWSKIFLGDKTWHFCASVLLILII